MKPEILDLEVSGLDLASMARYCGINKGVEAFAEQVVTACPGFSETPQGAKATEDREHRGLGIGNTFQKNPNLSKIKCYKPPSLLLVHLEKKSLNVELITTTNVGFHNSSGPTKPSLPPSLLQLFHSSLNHVA